MNAVYLHLPNGEPTGWSMCGECHSVACPGNFDLTVKCCTCYDCGKPLAKDERIPYADGKGRSLYHRECERRRRMERDAEALEKAELVIGYGDPVYCEGRRGSYGEGYFADVVELSESFGEGEEIPEFAFCCESTPFAVPDASDLIESACEEMDEDASDRLDGVEEFEKAVDAFNKINDGVIAWYEDRKRKVSVPR